MRVKVRSKTNSKSQHLHTWQSAVVGDEARHVYVLVVDTQVLHAAHKLAVAHREVLWEFGHPTEEQRSGQVQ